MNKHFVFRDDSWWDNPGCDCCESYLVDAYNCTSHPELYYTMGGEYEMYQSAALLVEGFDINDYETIEKSLYYTMDFDDLLNKCKELGITVEVQDGNSSRY